jgi:hypothetical protein
VAHCKSTTSIPPFPSDIDRDYFGAWLSGFVDGEGCFYLGVHKRKTSTDSARAFFQIKVRDDDEAIIRRIQSFLQCGWVKLVADPGRSGNHQPQAVFRVNSIVDCFKIITPIFEKYPLLAKKADDFRIWSEAVRLFYTVSCRPRKRHVLFGKGTVTRWEKGEFNTYLKLSNLLRKARAYRNRSDGRTVRIEVLDEIRQLDLWSAPDMFDQQP